MIDFFKGNVFCSECKFLKETRGHRKVYQVCESPYNVKKIRHRKSWYSRSRITTKRRKKPEQINKWNRCKWFKPKEK